jgi:hypothetical protein
MSIRKFFCGLLAATVCALSVSAAEPVSSQTWLVSKNRSTSAPFTDVSGSWCESSVKTVYAAALMDGVSSNRFSPKQTLTNGQILAVSARFLNRLKAGDGKIPAGAKTAAWYQCYYDYLTAQGVEIPGALAAIWDASSADPAANRQAASNPCQRQLFVQMLSAVLKCAGISLPAVNQIASLPDTRDIAVLGFYNAGILNGRDSFGTFRSQEPLNRGQAAAMLARLVNPQLRLRFALKSFDLCQDVFQVSPQTAVLTADGKSITMEQFACALATALNNGSSKDSPAALRSAAVDLIRQDLAVKKLAGQLALTGADAAGWNAAPYADFAGITETGWRWQADVNAANAALEIEYASKHSSDHREADFWQDVLTADLAAAGKVVQLTPQTALLKLDLSACRLRLRQSPFAYADLNAVDFNAAAE